MKSGIVALYTLTGIMLALGAYLRAPSVLISAAILFCTVTGIEVADRVLNQKNRDAEIVGLIDRMTKLEKEHRLLSMDITNVSERAKTILGETY